MRCARAVRGESDARGQSDADDDGRPSEIAELVDIGGGRGCNTRAGHRLADRLFISGTARRGRRVGHSAARADADAVSSFDAVSATTRVCTLRPPRRRRSPRGRRRRRQRPAAGHDGAERRRPHALIDAAGQSGPYVVVGLSSGGFIAQQFARTYSEEVEGIVLLESASAYLKETVTPEQWAAWMHGRVERRAVRARRCRRRTEHGRPASDRAAARHPCHRDGIRSSVGLQVTPGTSTWPRWRPTQAASRRLSARRTSPRPTAGMESRSSSRPSSPRRTSTSSRRRARPTDPRGKARHTLVACE